MMREKKDRSRCWLWRLVRLFSFRSEECHKRCKSIHDFRMAHAGRWPAEHMSGKSRIPSSLLPSPPPKDQRVPLSWRLRVALSPFCALPPCSQKALRIWLEMRQAVAVWAGGMIPVAATAGLLGVQPEALNLILLLCGAMQVLLWLTPPLLFPAAWFLPNSVIVPYSIALNGRLAWGLGRRGRPTGARFK